MEFCKLILSIKEMLKEDNINLIEIVSKIDQLFDKSIFECNRKIYESDEEKYEPGSEFINVFTLKTALEIGNKIFVPNGNYKTIHKSKGKEYEKVLIDLKSSAINEESQIDAIDVVINPYIYGINEISEFVRIFYVGISRAMNELIVVLDGTKEKAIKLDNCLNKYISDENISEKFYEIIIK